MLYKLADMLRRRKERRNIIRNLEEKISRQRDEIRRLWEENERTGSYYHYYYRQWLQNKRQLEAIKKSQPPAN